MEAMYFIGLFMVHELEEILLLKWWSRRKQTQDLMTYSKVKPFGKFYSTGAFSIAVLEELLILILIATYSALMDDKLVLMGVIVAFIIHYLPHVFMTLKFRSYTPGVVTALCLLWPSIQLLKGIYQGSAYSILEVLVASLISLLVLGLNLKLLHRMMPKFHQFLNGNKSTP